MPNLALIETKRISVYEQKRLVRGGGYISLGSVADPNPDPTDTHVFGPPGSGSISHRYRIRILLSLSKNSKKTLDFYFFASFFDLP